MTQAIDPNVLRAARSLARNAMRDGARAVVLMGSHARGEAAAHSDIDLVAIGRGSEYGLYRRGPYLVSVAWHSFAAERALLRTPRTVGTAVPGWRDAVILRDPEGVARRLQRLAVAFRWEPIAAACDDWVAEEITGFAEEVHKLVAATEQRRSHMAAVQRSLLALRLAAPMAVRHRILFGTENVLWDRIGDAMGARWRRVQARAFGEGGESLAVSGRAALELYALAATEAWELFDRQQRDVVAHACTIAGYDVRPRKGR